MNENEQPEDDFGISRFMRAVDEFDTQPTSPPSHEEITHYLNKSNADYEQRVIPTQPQPPLSPPWTGGREPLLPRQPFTERYDDTQETPVDATQINDEQELPEETGSTSPLVVEDDTQRFNPHQEPLNGPGAVYVEPFSEPEAPKSPPTWHEPTPTPEAPASPPIDAFRANRPVQDLTFDTEPTTPLDLAAEPAEELATSNELPVAESFDSTQLYLQGISDIFLGTDSSELPPESE